ncbi:MAG: hypothetical protein GY795_13525 [Desulfobacterales bacterium]|nr:hypothetical protein [Desulfobacterales bacterium]
MNNQDKPDFINIIEAVREIYNTIKDEPDCPSDELLDSRYNELPEYEYDEVAEHIRNCMRCRVKLLKIEADHIKSDYYRPLEQEHVWDIIVRKYWKLVYSAIKKTLDIKGVSFITEEGIEDVCQDVFVRLFSRGQKKFDAGPGFTRRIILIANSTALDHLDKKGFGSIPLEASLTEFSKSTIKSSS